MTAFRVELREGWRDLLGSTIGLACGIGFYTPITSLFFRALEREFHWSKTAAAASLLALPITALCLPFAGWLLDRFGVRITATVSVFLLSACFFWLSVMDGSLTSFYAAIICLNVCGCATGPVSYTRVVAGRFHRARGFALATALVGIAAAGMIMPPVVAAVLADEGWRAGYRLLAIIAFIGGSLAVLLIKPEEGRRASGGRPAVSLGAAVTSRPFWTLAIAIFCISAAAIGFVSQFQSVLIESGSSSARATYLLSTLSLSVICSRLIVGWALDRFRSERVAAIALIISAIGMSTLLLRDGGFAYMITAVVLIGLSIGAELDLLSFFCARLFGIERYAFFYGALAFFFYTGMGAGGLLYGLIHDASGSYAGAIALSAGLLAFAAGLFVTLRTEPTNSTPASLEKSWSNRSSPESTT